MVPCAVDGCTAAARRRGWCPSHYGRWYRWGDPLADKTVGRSICEVDGCGRRARSRGLCGTHKWRLDRGLDLAAPVQLQIRGPVADRFWPRVSKSDTCWLWTGALDRDGYGYFGRDRAHRVSYEMARGPIPDGLVIDHLCKVRNCVRPDHLDAVTPQENQRRSHGVKTHCKRGHEFSPENTHINSRGARVCRQCGRLNQMKYAERRAG